VVNAAGEVEAKLCNLPEEALASSETAKKENVEEMLDRQARWKANQNPRLELSGTS
jgi:hypothetical protein